MTHESMPSDKKKKYSSFFNARIDILEPENSMKGIYLSLDEFKSSLEEIDPVLRNMDAPMLQKMNEGKDKSDQKVK